MGRLGIFLSKAAEWMRCHFLLHCRVGEGRGKADGLVWQNRQNRGPRDQGCCLSQCSANQDAIFTGEVGSPRLEFEFESQKTAGGSIASAASLCWINHFLPRYYLLTRTPAQDTAFDLFCLPPQHNNQPLFDHHRD